MAELTVRVGIIKHISLDHINSAIHLAKLAHQTEQEFVSMPDEGIPVDSHRAYVVGSILLCVAFIESRINELIVGVAMNINPWNEGKIDLNVLESIREMGKVEGIMRLRTLEKYQLFLSATGKRQFNVGKTPYQDIALIIALRNKLVHFEPEVQWQDDEHRFMKKFRNKKLPLNPLTQPLNRIEFPDSLLGYGFAKWAIQSSIRFTSDFDLKIDLNSPYKGFDKSLP